MHPELRAALEAHFGASVVSSSGIRGGCIHDARLAELADGRRIFVKASTSMSAKVFAAEANGLEALGAVGVLRVPEVLAWGELEPNGSFLALEAIETGVPDRRFFEDFGRRFAELHRAATAERYGLTNDNHLGATPQPNPWTKDWVAFWRRYRLGHQLELARSNGHLDPELGHLGERLIERLDAFLAEPAEPPTLLHGDLWSGNFLVASTGEPVLIDPATYFGRREADLAMTRLFGGFDARFYAAYEEVWPLAPGFEERLSVYELYHLLNHLNLFGGGYRSGCVTILRRLVG